MSDFRAIPPCRYVCVACGKTSATRYGFDPDHDRGWDASCMLNAALCEPTGLLPLGAAWRQVKGAVEDVHYKSEPAELPASDGVVCPTCGEDMTLCEHGNQIIGNGNGCATACMHCGAQVPDLGPLKTSYVCDDCKARRTL